VPNGTGALCLAANNSAIEKAASRSWREYVRNAMCVCVAVTPSTLFSPPGMTSASSSCARTRTIATRS
jgi:hypothetical protein